MNRRVKTIIIALTTVLLSNSLVSAAPAPDMSSFETQIQNSENKIEMLDNQIEKIMKNIDSNNKEIQSSGNDIAKLEKDITNTQNNIQDKQDMLNKRIRSAYMTGTEGYLEILMSSKNFEEFLSNAQILKSIIDFDNDAIKDLFDKKQEIITTRKKIKEKEDALIALKTDNEKKLKDLAASKDQENKAIAETKEKEKEYAVQFAQEQAKIKAQAEEALKQARLAEAQRQSNTGKSTTSVTASSRGSSGPSNSNSNQVGNTAFSGNSVISYASKFLGTPYVWGGTTPVPGFDCSGFLQYVYAHFGVSIDRTTYDQIHDGVEVSKDNLQPGDLIFFGTWSDPHHVGMYIGNNLYIHAPHTGDVIKISQLDRNDFLTARRVR